MILTWLKSAALVALIAFLGFGSYLIFVTAQSEKLLVARASKTFDAADAAITHVNSATDQVGTAFTSAAQSLNQTESDVRGLTTQFGGVASGLQRTVALVNAPCVPGPCGTVADTNKTLASVRGTFGQIEIAANDFNKNETHFYEQEDVLFANANDSVKQFDALLASPDLATALHGGATTATNLGLMTGDAQTKFHDFLYPPPCVGWKCRIKGIYEGVRIGSQLAEPAYWSWALFSGIKP
jgi:hypothetical protein